MPPQSWLGFQPMILVMTGVTAASTYVATPNNPNEDIAILQIWLQVRPTAIGSRFGPLLTVLAAALCPQALCA